MSRISVKIHKINTTGITFVFTFVLSFFVINLSLYSQTESQTFTYTGYNQTFTMPANITKVKVECWGGGGGGSRVTKNGSGRRGGGGGGGAYASSVLNLNQGSYTVYVGGGGSYNTDGDESSFNSTTVLANGGKGALDNNSNGGSGGSGETSYGQIKYSGGNGGIGDVTNLYSGGGGGAAGSEGEGYSAIGSTGGAARNQNGGSGANGVTGVSYGVSGNDYGGGGSGGSTTNSTNRTGGSGANGLVVITWILPYEVNASEGTAVAYYRSLKLAFDNINNGTHRGTIIIKQHESSIETTTATLNASGSGSASYSSVVLYPTGPDLSITGNINEPLINLNGADNVRINGSVYLTNGFASLIIQNTNTGNGASTVYFGESAQNNSVTFCNLKGVSQGTTSGVVYFGGSSTDTGNDNDTIQHCNISGTGVSSTTRPRNAVYSLGSASYINNNNVIRYNNFVDVLNPGNSSTGVNISNFSEAYTIQGNSFYETTTFSPTTTVEYNYIYLNTNSGGFDISGNFIGGNNASATGTLTKSSNNTIFRGIYLNVAATPRTSLQGNTIKGFNWSNSGNATWTGIEIAGGGVDAGNISGNNIGDATSTGSVYIRNATNGGIFYGIHISSTESITINNSVIGSVDFGSTNTTYAANLYGIYKTNSAGDLNLNFNLIGSTSADNSFHASSLATANAQTVIGIYSGGTGATLINGNTVSHVTNATTSTLVALTRGIMTQYGSNTITNNTVNYISTLNAQGNNYDNATLIGIMQISTTAGTTQTITGNTVHNLKDHTTETIEVYGIFYKGPSTGTNIISRNFIHTYDIVSNINAYLHGISLHTGTYAATNNIVFLGNNITTGCKMWGIWNYSNDPVLIAFNTSYLSGQATDGESNSYAFRDISTAPTNRVIVNNILWNGRTNTTAIAHYAIFLAQTGNTTLDYNDYQFAQSFGMIGTTPYDSLADWVSNPANNFDNNSFIIDPQLTNLGGFSPSDYQAGVELPGTPVSGYTTDFGFSDRDPLTPTIGAWEFVAKPVEIWYGAVRQKTYTNLKAAFDEINSGLKTGNMIIKIKGNTNETATAVLDSSGSGSSSYTNIIIYPTRSDVQVKGNLTGTLIELNGADNVIFDGRIDGAGTSASLMIVNESTTGSNFRFINSAESNTVRYCNIRGLSNSATTGLIHFSTSTSGNGNDNNIITDNNITVFDNGMNTRIINAIYSSGTSTRENSGIQILNNVIYNTWSLGVSSNYINISSNTTAITISGNSFYETTSFVPTSNFEYRYISIDNTSGNSFVVSGNYIGGTAALAQGSHVSIGSTSRSTTLRPIYLNVGTSAATSVQGNLIRNINLVSTNAAPFAAIYINSGAANVGTVTGNTIGKGTGNGSILLQTTAVTSDSYGIYKGGAGDVTISNNTIGAITTSTTSSTRGHGFAGIYNSNVSGAFTVTNNIIGSTSTSSSVNLSSTSTGNTQLLYGIYSSGTGQITIRDNTICSLSNQSTQSSTSSNAYGLYFSTSTNASNIINRNFVYDIFTANDVTGSASQIIGIGIYSGVMYTVNNIIVLGNSVNTRVGIYGIYDAGSSGQSYVYYNTVYLSGWVNNTTSQYTAPYYRAASSNTANVRNNIFSNARMSGGAGVHLAIRLTGTDGLTKNYNNYILGTYGFYGLNNTTSYNSFSNWTSATGSESGSQNKNPFFTSAGALVATAYRVGTDLFATPISGFTSDYGLNTRSGSNPTMGAWERVNKWKGSVSIDWNDPANWTDNSVPAVDDNVVFDDAPSRPCFLDQNRSVTDISNTQSTYRMVTNGYKITIKGNLNFTNGAQIDASASGSTVEFAGTVASQTIPSGAFFNDRIFNLTINNPNNVVLLGTVSLLNNLTVTSGLLDATSAGATFAYSGTSVQSIESSRFLSNQVYNLVADNPAGLLLNTSFTVSNNMTINSGDNLTIIPTVGLTVNGTTTNNAGNSGLLLQSTATNTASLIHNSAGVAATVQRYIAGDTADWHFLSAPLSGQAIHSTTWTPSGTYGDGTGYDLYIWDEPSSCWIYNLNTTVAPTWPSKHPTNTFVPGRGYLYAIRDINTTKQFAGTLNNGTISQSLTYLSDSISVKGFNFIGNPYPSSIDWTINAGFSRSMLQLSGGGYNMWTWSASANNYGVYNSSDPDGIGTNNITRYISPMQGFFVYATSADTFNFNNSARVHNEAGNWHKSAVSEPTGNLSVSVFSQGGFGSDEVEIWSGYTENEGGARKLFSHVPTAPGLYLMHEGVSYTIKYITSGYDIPKMPLYFKAGKEGYYNIRCKFDNSFIDKVFLEDKKTGAVSDLSLQDSYAFASSPVDLKDRFVLHFGKYTPENKPDKSLILVNNGKITIDFSTITTDYEYNLYDLNGRIIAKEKIFAGETKVMQLPHKGIYLVNIVSATDSFNFKAAF